MEVAMELKHLLNKSEAISLIKEEENIDISRETPHAKVVSTLERGTVLSKDKCSLIPLKVKMQDYINKHMTKIRTQLPSCTGQCTEFGCPVAVVTNCWIKMNPLIESKNNGK